MGSLGIVIIRRYVVGTLLALAVLGIQNIIKEFVHPSIF